VALSPDSTLLATAGDDGTVQLWNPATDRRVGTPLQTGSGPAGGVFGVAFSSGGTLLVTADGDGIVRLWNPATDRRVGTPLHVSAHDGAPAVAFSPHGTLLAAVGLDGTVGLWNLATHGRNVAKITDLVPYLCASAGQPLTRSEWARYVPQGLAYQRVCPEH
jgi:WD40 repeat protein